MDAVSNHLYQNSKNSVTSLFLDFTSAFNTISPTTLVNKLIPTNLNSNIINWTYNYLTNRQQKVITPNSTLAMIVTAIGSSQGCVPSPILFSIYTDQIISQSYNIKSQAYKRQYYFIQLQYYNIITISINAECSIGVSSINGKIKKKTCFNNKPWNNQNITDKLVGTHGTGHKGILLSNTHSLRICDRSLDATFSIRGVKAINQSKTCEYMFKFL